MSASDRRAKLDRDHADLSMRRQCAMLGVARSGVYRKPRPANDNDLEGIVTLPWGEREASAAQEFSGCCDGGPPCVHRHSAKRAVRLG